MKRFRSASVLLSIVLFTGLMAAPVQAAMYQDVLTVTTDSLFVPTGGLYDPSLNLWGLDLVTFNNSFDLIMTYDSDTYFTGMNGGFSFGALSPANTMSLIIEGTDGSVTFNETYDHNYNNTIPFPGEIFQGPQAYYTPAAAFDPAASTWNWINYLGGRNDVPGVSSMTLYLADSGSTLEILGEGDSGIWINLSVNTESFDISTDRTAVPIPGALMLLAPGLLTLLGIRRRQLKYQ